MEITLFVKPICYINCSTYYYIISIYRVIHYVGHRANIPSAFNRYICYSILLNTISIAINNTYYCIIFYLLQNVI